MDIKECNLKNIPVPVGKMSFQEKTLSCPFVGFCLKLFDVINTVTYSCFSKDTSF